MKTALLASYTKDEPLLRLATALQKHDWRLTGSAGTAKFLTERGIPCADVGERIGKPILGHRVVTLAREIYAALLSTPNDTAELAALKIDPIDLVYVTLYPLEETIKAGKGDAEVIEKTDIGGPTLLRAAAKGRRITLSSSDQIPEIEAWLEAGEPHDEHLISKLAGAAERRVSEYAAISAAYWEAK